MCVCITISAGLHTWPAHSSQLIKPVLACLSLVAAVADTWTKINTGTYLGTIAFAYLCFVMFLLFFFALVIFQSAVNQELGLRECCV